MTTRRDFIKKAAYAAPVIATLSAKPSFAGSGSGWQGSSGQGGGGHRHNRIERKKRRQELRNFIQQLLDYLRGL